MTEVANDGLAAVLNPGPENPARLADSFSLAGRLQLTPTPLLLN